MEYVDSMVKAIKTLADPDYEIEDDEAADIAYGFARYGITAGWVGG